MRQLTHNEIKQVNGGVNFRIENFRVHRFSLPFQDSQIEWPSQYQTNRALVGEAPLTFNGIDNSR